MKLVGDSHKIWKGALKNVIWPEGPHLYKKDGYYYLMIAEGGTGPDHCISVARSKDILRNLKGIQRIQLLHTDILEKTIRLSMSDMAI